MREPRAKLDLLVNNEAVVFDKPLFQQILRRYGLSEKRNRFHAG